jgi:DNA polymerase-3 subunit delta'
MTPLIGHDEQIAALLDAADAGRLHHAWLLAGPRGVGKGLFARAVARHLLAEAAEPGRRGDGLDVDFDHPTVRLIEAGSHPDYRVLERLPRDTGHDLARNISIAQVRALQSLFATTPSQSSRRVVVIDAVDDLERSAANALLKNLEEPPADTIFFLVSHAPGRLLPTIRSRCRVLRFQPLNPAQSEGVIRAQLPNADDREIDALVVLADGAPGMALRFAGLDVAGLDRALTAFAETGDPNNIGRSALARSLALKAAQPRFEAFLERAPAFIASLATRRRGAALEQTIAAWESARSLAASAVPLSLDPQSVTFELGSLVAALAPKAPSAKG